MGTGSDIYRKPKIRDGFEGEKVIYIPEKIVKEAKDKTQELFHIYITQIGFFPKAAHHFRERETGCRENILIYCVQGKGHCILDNKQYEIGPNQFILIPATNKYVCYWADELFPWTIYWLHYSSDKIEVINKSLNIEISNAPATIPPNENSIRIWQNIYKTLEMGYSHENLISASFSLSYLLATFLFPERHADDHYEGDIITRTIEHMRKNLHTKLTVEEMASKNRLSASHFSCLFRKATDMPPMDYFIHLKMQKACQLLYLGTDHVKGISMELGYENPYYFSRIFKKYIGTSPKEYRQKNKIIG
ncbi:AraC family transcriptional regulator [Arcticibacter sp.]|jgi:AraC-like DNA-binding protein|uniref:AraC family transcriptional regulator n=1 Tax=Arcticibacter sp. TaxID=1872630 RepID=UPI00388F45BE